MEPASWMRFHPFVSTLQQWASGVSASCGDPWSDTAIQAAVERGPHTSALTPEARVLIEEEMQYQIQAGFSEMVTWDSMRGSHPANLKVSPLAVIPQVGRRGRLYSHLLEYYTTLEACTGANRQQYTKLLSQMADCELVRLTLSDPQTFEDQNVQLPIISDSCIQLYISHKDVESRI